MDKPERRPGTWGKTPSERLAASREKKQRTQGAPPSPRAKADASAPIPPRRASSGRKTNDSHTANSGSRKPRAARSTERPRQTRTTTSAQNADSHLIRVGGVEISVRILFTLIMVGLLASLVLPTVIQWVRQEHIRNETIAQLEEARARQSDVQRQLDLWADPEYIASQARERLGYVKPGETQYSVVDPGPEYQDTAQVAAAAPRGPARPWMYNFVVLTALADSTADVPAQHGALRTPEQSIADQPASDTAQSAQSAAQPQSADGATAQDATDQENPEGESE